MSGSGGGGGGGGPLSGLPEAPMPEGQSVQSILAQASKGSPWQGTPLAQWDPGYRSYVESALGRQLSSRDIMRGQVERMLGAANPGQGDVLNAYQLAQRNAMGQMNPEMAANSGSYLPGVPQAMGPLAGAKYTPMSYEEWKALRLPTGGGSDGGGGTTPPTPDLGGLIAQASDPWTTYGQMGVANPYLTAINNRFGWSPEGLAYGFDLRQQPTWYQPPYVMPKTVLPKISGGTTTSWT